jgi:hypothetical protein
MPPFVMPIFNSKSLELSIHSNEIPKLSEADLKLLKEELFDAIEGIHKTLSEMQQFQNRHGYKAVDDEWEHRAKMKLRICTQFAARIESSRSDAPVLSYKDAYIKRLHEILAEELDPKSLEKIEQEASELARMDVE